MRRTWRWLLGVLIATLLVVALAAWLLLRGSLADLEGEHALPGLSAAVTVERDALGVVTITAGSQADAMRALGRVHAQERYFEMDLMRRRGGGGGGGARGGAPGAGGGRPAAEGDQASRDRRGG
ncbi:penicillin acylase family protein, partial [Stenotrophomonas maltophilia]|nr:penicillin acylase family protein [Stenotrophomonas maltophilia]